MSMAGGGYWAIPLELSPKHVGAISGVMVSAGAIASALGPDAHRFSRL